MILYRPEVTHAICRGAQTMRDAVAPTIGPTGGGVLARLEGNIIATRSGSFVARIISQKPGHEGRAMQIITQAANRVFECHGTGATTTILLTADMVQAGARLLAAGVDPANIGAAIREEADRAAKAIAPAPIPGLREIARTAACHDEHGDVAFEHLQNIPDHAFLEIEPGMTPETYMERTETREYACKRADSRSAVPQGADQTLSPCHFVAAEKNAPPEAILEELEKLPASAGGAVIVSVAFDPDAMELILTNRLHGGLPMEAMTPPAFGPLRDGYISDLEFLAGDNRVFPKVTTGERFMRVETGRRVEEVEARAAWIEGFAKRARTYAERAALRERSARLRGCKYTLHVGARSEPEGRWKAAQIEAAVSAMIETQKEGGTLGAGAAFLLDPPNNPAQRLIYEAGRGILRQIADNAGLPGRSTVERISRSGGALDARTGKSSRRIVDPITTARTILRTSASTAAMLLTVEASL